MGLFDELQKKHGGRGTLSAEQKGGPRPPVQQQSRSDLTTSLGIRELVTAKDNREPLKALCALTGLDIPGPVLSISTGISTHWIVQDDEHGVFRIDQLKGEWRVGLMCSGSDNHVPPGRLQESDFRRIWQTAQDSESLETTRMLIGCITPASDEGRHLLSPLRLPPKEQLSLRYLHSVIEPMDRIRRQHYDSAVGSIRIHTRPSTGKKRGTHEVAVQLIDRGVCLVFLADMDTGMAGLLETRDEAPF